MSKQPDIGWCPSCNRAVVEIPHGTCSDCSCHTMALMSRYEHEELLSASQASEKELREKLEAAEALNSLQAQSIGMLSKELEAVEARIKASQEQEPVDWGRIRGYLAVAIAGFDSGKNYDGPIVPAAERMLDAVTEEGVPLHLLRHLYTQPPIPPELAELQRQVEFWKSSSQEWKLAYVAIGGTASESGKAELRKLLEESKVPGGWQLVPKEPTMEMRAEICKGRPSKDNYRAMLAAAPQPKEPAALKILEELKEEY